MRVVIRELEEEGGMGGEGGKWLRTGGRRETGAEGTRGRGRGRGRGEWRGIVP